MASGAVRIVSDRARRALRARSVTNEQPTNRLGTVKGESARHIDDVTNHESALSLARDEPLDLRAILTPVRHIVDDFVPHDVPAVGELVY